MRILGIETSCDETAAAVVENGTVLSSSVATQHDVHEKFGGVVPELASRRHMENIVPLIRDALEQSKNSLSDIDAIAVTHAPGLVPALLIGIAVAKGIAYSAGIPLIGVNHLEGHLGAAGLEFGRIPLPYVGLVVSGGHTSLYLVHGFGDYKLLGATRDDAAGEAFDKVAKLLQLGYPGGPAIEAASRQGNPHAFKFARPKFSDGKPLDFSFSGVKTAVLLLCRRKTKGGTPDKPFTADVAASFQEMVAITLVDRLMEAARLYSARAVVLAGGVAANERLRALLSNTAAEAKLACYIPSHRFCTDNAAMIAYIGEKYLAMGKRSEFTLNAIANQEIGT